MILASLAMSFLLSGAQEKVGPPPVPQDLRPRNFMALPFDLAGVKGLDTISLSEAARKVLAKNGFVVVGPGRGNICACYRETESHPPLVTVDSVLEVFLSDFENAWSQLEKAQAKRFATVHEGLWNALVERFPTIPEGAARIAGSRLLALVAVGRLLGDPDWAVPDRLPQGIEADPWRAALKADLEAVRRETGLFESTLWKRRLDASAFLPVGPYAEDPALSAWHRVSVWWNSPGFRAEDPEEALAVGLLAWILGDYKLPWTHVLNQIEENYDLLLSPPFDVAPRDLYSLDGTIGDGMIGSLPRLLASAGAPKAIAGWFRDQYVRDPIAGYVPGQMVKGPRRFHLLPPRPTPEGGVFSRLTRNGENARLLPQALDYLAVAGSDRAREIVLEGEPEGSRREQLEAGIGEARRELAKAEDRAWGLFPDSLRWAMRALVSPPMTPDLPLFARTAAWRDRGISSALAAWAGTREIYNVRTIVGYRVGGLSDIVGLAEPHLEAWQRLAELWHAAFRGFKHAGVPFSGNSLGMALRFRRIAEKQIRGEALTESEKNEFRLYDVGLSNMMRKSSIVEVDKEDRPEEPDRRVALAFARSKNPDVVRFGGKSVALLYAIVEWQGRLQLVTGGVLEYREFDRPGGASMGRKEFRALMDSPAAPPVPEWTRSYRVDR